MPPCIVECETWLDVCKCAPLTTGPNDFIAWATTQSSSSSTTTTSTFIAVYIPNESSAIVAETTTQSAPTSSMTPITPTSAFTTSTAQETSSTQYISVATTVGTAPTATPAKSAKFLPSERAALIVGTIFGGLIVICVAISLCFWCRKKWEKHDRRRQIERLRIQDSVNRTSRWHNESEDYLPQHREMTEKAPGETNKDTGLPLLPGHVFKFEDMPKRHTPLMMNLPPPGATAKKSILTTPSHTYVRLPDRRRGTQSKRVRVQSTVTEEDLYPPPLNITRFQKPVPPLPPAKLAPERSSSIYPPITALPPIDTFSGPQMQQKTGVRSPITGKSLPSKSAPTLGRSRRNPIRKSLIPIYFMGNRGDDGNDQAGRLRNSLSQGAAKLVAGPVAIHNALFGSRRSSRHRGTGASANCNRTNSVGTYTTIESTDSVRGSALGTNRRSANSHGRRSVRPPVRPIPATSGNGRGRSAGERLSRLSRASRSSEALPSGLQVRFKTPSLNKKRHPSSSIYSSRAQAAHGSILKNAPPVPPKSQGPRSSITRKPVPQQGLKPAGPSLKSALAQEGGTQRSGKAGRRASGRRKAPESQEQQYYTYFI